MALDDNLFLTKINDISRRIRLDLPKLTTGDLPPTEFLAHWAKFLEDCVKSGLTLADERWQRLTVKTRSPYAVFSLERSSDASADPDFRVGLQLLLGLLERDGFETEAPGEGDHAGPP
jgi:hypothetical protein